MLKANVYTILWDSKAAESIIWPWLSIIGLSGFYPGTFVYSRFLPKDSVFLQFI